jgi:hypothetical protein
MAPVLAITGMVARTVDTNDPFDPVGEIFQLIVTGPNQDARQEAVAKPQGEKGMGAALAIGGPVLAVVDRRSQAATTK